MSDPFKVFDFIPADTLFCRDQRPLAAGHSFGRGANWPLPTVLHSAIRTALLRANGGLPTRKGVDGRARKGIAKKVASTKYQWLNLRGPFPVDEKGVMYFPIPRDLVPDGKDKVAYLKIIPNAGTNNLPVPLTHLAASFAAPSKAKLPEWISESEYAAYLAGNLTALPEREPPEREPLWDSEHRMGVEINPATHTAAEGKLYAAEHLRLRDGVRLRFAVSEPPKHKPADPSEPLSLAEHILQLGGEQRFGKVSPASGDWKLPEISIAGNLIKWVLLTPAIFVHGWRPGWVDEAGHVKLRVVDKATRAERRRPRYDNQDWKYDEANDQAERIGAKLVAACVGKPQVVGGWDDQPKPTSLAVPSGSVYYFRADNETEAQKLAGVLQGRCKSDFFGEKGLGLGVCGMWQEGSEA
ncbi:MAG: type III-B CRISPR module-associated protein Cmr3 [Bryobacteraceae bacterium]|nr:type III-B CRISPR module-associated protein Cmr3 [Bryobacteraceae bacterium]